MQKRILVLFTISIALISFACSFTLSFAQESDLLFAVTPYKTREDIDVLFTNSTRVLEYLEGEDVEEPLFLSLITQEQKQSLIDNGFTPRVLDERTDLSRYILLYTVEPDQSDLLKNAGEVFSISRHYTLLKTSAYTQFNRSEGVGSRFSPVPFSDTVVPPPLRTKTATELTPRPDKEPYTTPAPLTANTATNSFLPILIVLIVIFFLCGLIFFVVKKRRNQNQPPQPPLQQPPPIPTV